LQHVVSAAGAAGGGLDPDCLSAFEREYDYIFRTLRRFGASLADAEDLAQEVFLVMWRRWRDYDQDRPLRPWLAGIAFRLVYNHRTRIGREVPGGLIDTEDEAVDPEVQVTAARTRGLVLRLLATLPEKQRVVMVLHEIDGVPIRDVSRVLGVPLFTAYSRLRAARAGFATAVRRAYERDRGLALPSAQALLDAERRLPAAPTLARRRALSLATALVARLGNRPGAPGVPISIGGIPIGPMFGGAAVVAAAALALALVPATGRGRRPLQPSSPAPAVHRIVATSDNGLARGLVGYWRFDEGAGSAVARDLSGNGIDCQLRHLDPAASWTAGVHAGAVQLDGHGWLECAKVAALRSTDREITIALWVNRGEDDRLRGLVTRQHGDGKLDDFHFGFRDSLLMIQSSLWKMHLAAAVSRPRGRWIHVATTHGADNVARLYVDGEMVAHGRTRAAAPDTGDNPLLIGGGLNRRDPDTVSERLNGALDELVIYDRVLSPAEIAALAAGAQPAPAHKPARLTAR
jgi:RNA polymerase sigma-70 factor (ECF subfamily)